jgi:hypothetical protein
VFSVCAAYSHTPDAGQVSAGLHIPTPCQVDTRSYVHSVSATVHGTHVDCQNNQSDVNCFPSYGQFTYANATSNSVYTLYNTASNLAAQNLT